MPDMSGAIQEIYSLEQLSGGNSCIHRRHGLAKMLSTFVFIVTVVSFNRYEIGRLIPYIFYPVVLAALSDTPWTLLGKRIALALPFALFAGISNIIFDRSTALVLGSMPITFGTLSLIAIFLRTFLCVAAVMLLVAVTPFWDLSDQLRRLHLPDIFISMFEMTYRYIGTLLEEASTMYTAYMLRSPNQKGLKMKHMGSFTGQLLIRSYDRAERIYNAMKCMGYAVRDYHKSRAKFTKADWVYLAVTCVPCVLLRLIDVPALYSHALEALL
ncbi:MAG: cobalt ECF transporter T component CbiQ [Oscillospiraceae bacterium]